MLTRSPAPSRQGGVTLLELLVGLSVGSIVIVGLLISWAIFIQQNDYLLKSARLNQEIRAVFQVVTQDLRRAVSPTGASAIELVCLDAASGCDPTVPVPAMGDCIVFNINVDQSDVANSIITVPAGYRVRNGVLEMWWPGNRIFGTPNYGYVSSAGQCAADLPDNWIPIVESASSGLQNFRLQIATSAARCLDLYVATEETAGRCGAASAEKIEMLLLTVVLAGDAKVNSGVAQQFSFADAVKVRNDGVFE